MRDRHRHLPFKIITVLRDTIDITNTYQHSFNWCSGDRHLQKLVITIHGAGRHRQQLRTHPHSFVLALGWVPFTRIYTTTIYFAQVSGEHQLQTRTFVSLVLGRAPCAKAIYNHHLQYHLQLPFTTTTSHHHKRYD